VWTLGTDETVVFHRGGGSVLLAEDRRFVVNVGSVGQPRDGDPLAAYGLWDRQARTVDIRRIPYDVEEARRRIHAAGLPRLLGDRLRRGR
jgi:diadenosine tetraphosphatase ApaH/serine/threonine PP2A family protein phosphatase